jgi:hypothetical protein
MIDHIFFWPMDELVLGQGPAASRTTWSAGHARR